MYAGLILHKRPRWRTVLLVLALALALGLLRPVLLSNLGWLNLSHAALDSSVSSSQSVVFFDHIPAWAVTERTYVGLGIAYTLLGQEPQALEAWQNISPEVPLLAELGKTARENKEWDRALIYYHGANLNAIENLNEQAWRICQLAQLREVGLSDTHRELCSQLLQEQERNWIANGEFVRDTSSWRPLVEKGMPSIVALTPEGHDGFCISLENPQTRSGFYQQVFIPAGSQVTFQAWIKVTGGASLSTKLLVERHKEQGKWRATSATYALPADTWTLVERSFVTRSDAVFSFIPILAKGQGTIYADDIRVEIATP